MKDQLGTTLSINTIYHGRVFTVVNDKVKLPNGREASMDVIRHPSSVVLLPMPDSDHVILVRQYRYSIDRWIWELPAGTLEPSEDVVDAAHRECQEETGYQANQLKPMGGFYPSPGYSDEMMLFFCLTGLKKPVTPLAPDSDEVLEPKIFTLTEARRMVRDSDAMDMKTILGLSLI
tara:strand:+ start:72 stop:599 length:528 start_codon:yes stop_codon:yes gene_type:complete